MDNVRIKQPSDKISIYCESIKIFMHDLTVYANIARATQGGALNCINCKEVVIESSLFQGLQAKQGGALYFSQSESAKLNLEFPYYNITKTKFESNDAFTGGAIFF